ncbi:MAG: DUF898 domain-containing protein [Acidobacteria bacterium]|nr:DUF898 domain-containing protein [Acidobacteriota bacterium]
MRRTCVWSTGSTGQMNRGIQCLVWCGLWVGALSASPVAAQSLIVDVDVSVNAGAVRHLNGVNRRPGFSLRTPPLAVDATELYAAFGISQVRTHDTGLDLCETYTAATLTTSPPQTMSGCTVSGTPVGGMPTITWTPTSTATSALDSTANYDFTSVDTYTDRIIAAVLFGLATWLAALTHIQAHLTNALLSGIMIGPHRLVSSLRTLPLLTIGVTNLLLMVLTLGLFYPWARVRALRYQLDHLHVHAQGDLAAFTAAAGPATGPFGEAVGDVFDLDLDFGF